LNAYEILWIKELLNEIRHEEVITLPPWDHTFNLDVMQITFEIKKPPSVRDTSNHVMMFNFGGKWRELVYGQ
jgi:hypothetical protein